MVNFASSALRSMMLGVLLSISLSISTPSASARPIVGDDDIGHAGGQPLGHRQMQELVGPGRVAPRAAGARDEELRAGQARAEQGPERDRAAGAPEHPRLAGGALGGGGPRRREPGL